MSPTEISPHPGPPGAHAVSAPSPMEVAVAAAAALAEAMAHEAAQTPEGAGVVCKAQQLTARGGHIEIRISFGDEITAELGVRLDTGVLRVLGSKTMHRRPHGHA